MPRSNEKKFPTVGLVDYGTSDHATKYRSTAGTQAPVDPATLDDAMSQIDRDGYVILPDAVDADTIERIRIEAEPLFEHDGGRNDFEGFATRRLYSPLDETFALDAIIEHPIALGLLDRLLEPNYLLSQVQVIDILPGEAAQALHYDDGFYPWPRPRRALGVATIIAIDEFTADNGATQVIPGSHRWDDHFPTDEEQAVAIPAVMSPGSMLFFLGTTWHGGGENRTDRSRMCATAQYCAPFCRQQENFSLSVDRKRVAASSENVRRLLGYSIHPPFMGFVRGVHPKRLLENC